MLYAVDSKEEVLTGDTSVLTDDQINSVTYQFKRCERVSEDEMFRRFKKEYFVEKFKTDQANDCDEVSFGSSDGFYNAGNASKNNTYGNISPKANRKKYTHYPQMGYYLIPKLYGYFPFLDCDSQKQYDETCVELNMNNVQYVAYKSNKYDHHWIFCDQQGSFDETLKFIEEYPCDPRYAWVASYKREFCVRATTKKNFTPKRITDIEDTMSDDFRYWLRCFQKH